MTFMKKLKNIFTEEQEQYNEENIKEDIKDNVKDSLEFSFKEEKVKLPEQIEEVVNKVRDDDIFEELIKKMQELINIVSRKKIEYSDNTKKKVKQLRKLLVEDKEACDFRMQLEIEKIRDEANLLKEKLARIMGVMNDRTINLAEEVHEKVDDDIKNNDIAETISEKSEELKSIVTTKLDQTISATKNLAEQGKKTFSKVRNTVDKTFSNDENSIKDLKTELKDEDSDKIGSVEKKRRRSASPRRNTRTNKNNTK